MSEWFFVTDLHGSPSRYRKLFERVEEERPEVLLLGGDLLPNAPVEWGKTEEEFMQYLFHIFEGLKRKMGDAYPKILIILGNDDPRSIESYITEGEANNLWLYMHRRRFVIMGYPIYGYACTPPSPFLLKDWERYDVSRYVEPGCISPEEGYLTDPKSKEEIQFHTIHEDLEQLARDADMTNAMFLFHAPPYQTDLDLTASMGMKIENIYMDTHVGSIAIRRFIEKRQPHITLHGHIHESARLSGSWQTRLTRTYSFSAAHDGNELALIRFIPQSPENATRELI